MRIALAFKPPLRRWQRRLANELMRLGHDVVLRAGQPRRLGLATAVALALGQRVFGPRPSAFDTVASGDAAQSPQDHVEPFFDLMIALDGEQNEASRRLEPLFNGAPGDGALIGMLMSRGGERCVRVGLHADGRTHDTVVAHLAIQDPDVLSRALDQALVRLVTLVLQAVRRFELDDSEWSRDDAMSAPGKQPETGAGVGTSPLMHFAGTVVQKVAARLRRETGGPSHWRTGWRRLDHGRDARGERRWPTAPFTILPDDRSRFYADPVPFVHDGRSYIFLEDYPYATGKGVIAVTEIGPDGAASRPRAVLEQPCHLSYPVLIRHRGDIFMLPEMSGAGRLQLFRAAPFPDRWLPDRVLLDGVVAADATPVMHAGRWWLFAACADDGGSSWDQLCLFHAPDLFGPWTAHIDNPVLVDAGAARPAGAMWEENGVLMRVAQDCRAGYGRGLAICRVDRLDETGYAQTVVARLGPPDGLGADGTHTLDLAGDLEVVDLRFPPVLR